MSNDREDVGWSNSLAGSRYYMRKQRFAGNLVQHFGVTRLQACAFSGGENGDGELELGLIEEVVGRSQGLRHNLTGYQEKVTIDAWQPIPQAPRCLASNAADHAQRDVSHAGQSALRW